MLLPVFSGVLGSSLLLALYLGIVTWAQGWAHAMELLGQDLWLVAPIISGFGIQIGLFTYLRLAIRASARGATALAGAGTGTSTLGMVACCAHHVTDVLPLVGLSAAAAFLANYKVPFMLVGLTTNAIGIFITIRTIRNFRRHFPMTEEQ